MPPARPPSVSQKPPAPPVAPNAPENALSPPGSTPGASASTPSHLQASPHIAKSPKTKSKPKAARRASKAVAPTTPLTPSAASELPAASPGQAGPSHTPAIPAPTASSGVAPTPSAGTEASAAASGVAAHALTPSTSETLKRPREEDDSGVAEARATREETPTKRTRIEATETLEMELAKRQEEVDNIKTADDISQFYSDMAELLQLSNSGGSDLPPGMQESLVQLARTFAPGVTLPDVPSSSLTDTNVAPPPSTEEDPLFNYIDFSSWDTGKTSTPDLMPASSTNPSPESGTGSDAEHPPSSEAVHDHAKIVDASDSDRDPSSRFDSFSDPLRLGGFGEIDGGESSYYNGFDFKWDTSTAGDWAFTT